MPSALNLTPNTYGSKNEGETRNSEFSNELLIQKKFRDITGQRFGRLVAVKRVRKVVNGHNRTYWEFKCDCGNSITIRLDGVVNGAVKSCGCYQREATSARMKGGNATSFKKGQSAYNKGRPAREWMGEENVRKAIQRLRDNPPPPDHIRKVCEANKKPVVRMDLYGKVIEIHESINAAAKAINRSHTGVGLVCNHYVNNKGYPARSCGGYTFLFLDEYLQRFN